MGSVLTRGFKTIYAILFFSLFLYIITNIDTETLYDPTKLILIIDYLIAILIGIISLTGTFIVDIAFGIGSALSKLGVTIPFTNIWIGFNSSIGDGNSASVLATNNYITQLLQSIFPQSSLISSTTALDPITDPNIGILNVWGTIIAFVLFPVILLSAIGFLIRGESRLAITSFTALQGLIILTMYLPNATTGTGRMLLLDLSLPTFEGSIDSLSSDFMALLSSQIFQLGLGLYLLLEFAFQAAYTISVVDPMIDRERRIKEHLNRINNFRPQAEKEQQSIVLGKGASKKYDLVAASYLREMVEKRVFKRGEEVQDQKTTMRLQSYISSLRKTDRNFEEKITAISAQPRTSAILRSLIPLMAVRFVLVVILAFIIINPNFLIEAFVENPIKGTNGLIHFPQLGESVELDQPEFRTVIVFNIILLIIALSALLHWLLVHRPEIPEREIKKVDTIVEFQEIQEPVFDEEGADEKEKVV